MNASRGTPVHGEFREWSRGLGRSLAGDNASRTLLDPRSIAERFRGRTAALEIGWAPTFPIRDEWFAKVRRAVGNAPTHLPPVRDDCDARVYSHKIVTFSGRIETQRTVLDLGDAT